MAYNIDQIREMTEREAQEMALEHLNIKGHDVYIVDFGEYFGYSALVYLNGGHICYADDYELNHRHVKYNDDGTTENVVPCREALRDAYIEKMNSELFTVEELLEPAKTYTEEQKKGYYIHNYYGMQKPSISGWFFGTDAELEKMRKKVEKKHYCPMNNAYYDDEAFVEEMAELWQKFKVANSAPKSYEFMKAAFLREMYNHEYGINWQGDYDVLSCFYPKIAYLEQGYSGEYLTGIGMSEQDKRAYFDACREYARTAQF